METYEEVIKVTSMVADKLYQKPLHMRSIMQPPCLHGYTGPHIRIFSSEPQPPPDDLIKTLQKKGFSVQLIPAEFYPAI